MYSSGHGGKEDVTLGVDSGMDPYLKYVYCSSPWADCQELVGF